MKMSLNINVMIQDEGVDTHKIMNTTASLNQSLNSKANISVSSFPFVKGFNQSIMYFLSMRKKCK